MKTKLLLLAALMTALLYSTASQAVEIPLDKDDVPKGTWIAVSLDHFKLAVINGNDSDHPVKKFNVTVGRPDHPTPTGFFTVISAKPDDKSTLYDNTPMPYCLRLKGKGIKDGEIGIHGSINVGRDTRALTPDSHGCIRLSVEDAKTLFNLKGIGVDTEVFIYGDVEKYFKTTFDPYSYLVTKGTGKGKEVLGFKVAQPGATQADKDAFLELVKNREITIDHMPEGVVTTDKSKVCFRFEFQKAETGLTVASFEKIYNRTLNIRPFKRKQ